EIPTILERIQKLVINVPPFPQPRVAEEVLMAPAPEPSLSKPLELVVQRVPDIEEREEVGIRVSEPSMRGIGGGLPVERPLARILDAEARRNDQHLAQRLLAPGLQDHPADRRIDRQSRKLAPDRREL